MKLVRVDDLKGNEILALPVVSDAEVVLVQSGTVLKQDYIDRIKSLNLTRVYIEDEVSDEAEVGAEASEKKEPTEESNFEIEEPTDEISNRLTEKEIVKDLIEVEKKKTIPLSEDEKAGEEESTKEENASKEDKAAKAARKRKALAEVDNLVVPPPHIYKIEETKKDTEELVQKVLERHIYKHNQELKIIGEAADRILNSVLSEPEVIDNITEIRNISTDMYTHCINVCTLSTIMALRLKMSEKQVHNIAVGAILHDIGLRYIQVPYINRSEEDMNEKEALEYKKHTIYGYSSLQDETWISDISKEIILLHHERVDGSGYPFCQNGEKLRSEIKLVALCDEFDSLISGIGSRQMKIYEAIEYIKVHSGDIFDANIAAKLLESVAVYPVGMKVVTNQGEKGVVVRQNREATDRPVIRMTVHKDGKPYVTLCEKNLMKCLTVFIVDTE